MCHFLHDLLPEGLQRDLFSGDEKELALTRLDIVELLQYQLSVLQKAYRHVLASPPLVASDEMTPLEPADRHPALSQKLLEIIIDLPIGFPISNIISLPTSKQQTPPAAPASAPPLSSAFFSPSPLSLNLLQTGDSISCRQDNQHQPQGKGAAAIGPQTRACLSAARRF